MKIRSFAVAAVVAALTLTSCSGGNQETPPRGGNAEVGTTNDINPQDPATLQQGGNLRLALTDFPPNFNSLHIDGNTGDVSALHAANDATGFPHRRRRFTIGQHRLLHQRGADQHRPPGRHVHHQPEGGVERRHPDHVGGHHVPDRRDSGNDKAFAIASTQRQRSGRVVTRGVDDRQAIMTFAKPYAEWRGMFAGNTMLLPKSMTATPDAFNKGSAQRPRTICGTVHRLQRRPHRATNHVDAQPEMVGHPAAARQHHLPRARRRRAHPRAAEQRDRRIGAGHRLTS